MSVKYEDPVYASDRLNQTIVRHNDYPVFVDHISEDGEARILPLCKGDWEDVHYLDLDLTPVPLGNYNINGSVAYAQRMPKRRDWRQGLRDNNCRFLRVIGDFGRIGLNSKETVNTILGLYPSPEKVVESIICGEVVGAAFSRYFSLGKTRGEKQVNLFYKTEVVGKVVAGDQLVFELMQEKEFLREFLQEESRIG